MPKVVVESTPDDILFDEVNAETLSFAPGAPKLSEETSTDSTALQPDTGPADAALMTDVCLAPDGQCACAREPSTTASSCYRVRLPWWSLGSMLFGGFAHIMRGTGAGGLQAPAAGPSQLLQGGSQGAVSSQPRAEAARSRTPSPESRYYSGSWVAPPPPRIMLAPPERPALRAPQAQEPPPRPPHSMPLLAVVAGVAAPAAPAGQLQVMHSSVPPPADAINSIAAIAPSLPQASCLKSGGDVQVLNIDERIDNMLPGAGGLQLKDERACEASLEQPPGKRKAKARPRRCMLEVATHLRRLDAYDPRQVLSVRKIKVLGFSAGDALRKYFEEFGTVAEVLLSGAQEKVHDSSVGAQRIRPSGFGFVVMASPASAEAILRQGASHCVAEAWVEVQAFRSRATQAGSKPDGDGGDTE